MKLYFVLRREWGGSFSNSTLKVYLFQYTPTQVSMGTISDENERFGLVFVKTTVFMLKTGFKNPSTGLFSGGNHWCFSNFTIK